VNVIDGCKNGIGREKIPIKSGTFLPESERPFPRTFSDDQTVEQCRTGLAQQTMDLPGGGLLYPCQQTADFRIGIEGRRQEMNMLGHDDECNQLEAFFETGGVERAAKDVSPEIIGE